MDRPSTRIWLGAWGCGPSPSPTPPPHDVCDRGRRRRGRELVEGRGGRAVGAESGVGRGEMAGGWSIQMGGFSDWEVGDSTRAEVL